MSKPAACPTCREHPTTRTWTNVGNVHTGCERCYADHLYLNGKWMPPVMLTCSDFIAAGIWEADDCCTSCHGNAEEDYAMIALASGAIVMAWHCVCYRDRDDGPTAEQVEIALAALGVAAVQAELP